MSTKTRLQLQCVMAMVTVAGGAAPVSAEESKGSVIIEEVIVTAQRREERLLQVPVSMTAITGQRRDDAGLDSSQDIFNFIPGVSFNGASADTISVRGIGRLTQTIGTDSGVAVYNNGFYGASTFEASLSSLFNERVEVLRGPQGTLYGRNSIAGAINYVSRRPTDDLEAEVRAMVGDYDRTRYEGRLAGPLGNHFRASVTGSYTDQTDGYFRNVSGGPDEGGVGELKFGEVQLAFDAGERFDGWLRYFTGEGDQTPRNSIIVSPYNTTYTGLASSGATFGMGAVNAAYGAPSANPSVSDHRKIARDTPTRQLVDDLNTIIGHLTLHLSAADLRYVGGYSEYLFTNSGDADNTAFTSVALPGAGAIFPKSNYYVTDDSQTRSHELTLTSTGLGALQWILGYYYYEREHEQTFRASAANQPQYLTPSLNYNFVTFIPPFYSQLGATPNPNADAFASGSTLRTKNHAGFAQLDYRFADHWQVTLGARYSDDEKEADESIRIVLLDPTNYAPLIFANDSTFGLQRRQMEDSWQSWTGSLGLQWMPNEDTLGYLRYARGSKSGGFNLGSFDATPVVDPETVDAYELGWKQELGGQLQLTSAVFYNDYQDAQAPVSVPVTATLTIASIESIPKASTYGAEVEVQWTPTPNWLALLSYSYLRARIDEACCFVDTADPNAQQPGAHPTGAAGNDAQNLRGNSLPNAPEHKVGFNAGYTWHFAPGDLRLFGTYTWQDATYSSIFSTPDYRAPDYDLVSLQVNWRHTGGRWELLATVNNLLDDEAQVQVTTNAPPYRYRSISLLAPRTWSLEARLRF